MRPLLGSATTTEPFRTPKAATAASRTVMSSPFRSSPKVEFPLLWRSTISFHGTRGLRVAEARFKVADFATTVRVEVVVLRAADFAEILAAADLAAAAFFFFLAAVVVAAD